MTKTLFNEALHDKTEYSCVSKNTGLHEYMTWYHLWVSIVLEPERTGTKEKWNWMN